MARLADYFLIVGYNHEKDKQGISLGKIVQRFPTTDWDDTPFIDGIELFCQPQGWALSTEQMEPRFFVSVLTDMDANRHYCACLTFNETVTIQPTHPVDEEEETFGAYRNEVQQRSTAVTHHSVMYAPKALVLVSRLDCFSTFRNCLGVLYAVYSDNLSAQLEGLVGNILGCVQVPPPGGPQIRFSIGAGDRQAYQPPLSTSIPTTGTCVAQLFKQLGIKPAMTLFSAAMTELKILMHSCSYWRLTEACRALSALMYPFKYSYVYIPVLPTSLSEVVTTPTPFIMGVHSNALDDMPELLDVIIVNLDGGCVTVPESIVIAPLPESVRKSTLFQLSKLLHPDLHTADHAFAASLPPSTEQMLDKEIRAVFLRLFAQLLQGYRNCLTLIRIHPTPVIAFHKASFLGQRGLVDCTFSSRLLDCMFFSTFVSERGLPWRPCDVFDEVYCGIGELLKMEAGDAKLVHAHVKELAQHLLLNERPNQQPFEERFPQPTEGAFRRIHQPVFPELDQQLVAQVIQEGLNNGKLKQRLASIKPPSCRIVPMGPHMNTLQKDSRQVVNNSARRLEVLRNCVSCIFESRISDARKSFPAVLRALKNRSARLVLCHELSQHVLGNKAILDNEQFDLVIRLMNCALQDDSSLDEYGVAAAMLPLATAFCRKLCTGIIQFAYTCIQEHMVWQNQQFWEAAYYLDVQADIQRLYAPQHESRYGVIDASGSQFGVMDGRDEHHRRTPSSSNSVSSATSSSSTVASSALRDQHRSSAELTALELAADQLRMRAQIENGKLQELIMAEESTVFSQAIHFANRIVFMRVPLDVASHRQRLHNFNERESNSNSLTTSVAETDSMTVESGFEDQEVSSAGQDVIKFVSRFVDQVCTESNVSSQHVRQLHQMVPGVVAMHIETMDAVSRESKRLPSTKKPKILLPSLLPGEEMVTDAVRVYLLPDGREEMTGHLGGPALLPAEGAFFITNYRLIFKGTPCDAYASEMTVVRCFPLSTLTKEKRMNVHYLVHLDQWLQEGLQLRSNTFQLLKLAFDEEVNGENIERLRKLIQRLRAPPSIVHLFAFRGQQFIAVNSAAKDKQKNATLRGFAKKTLLRTARKAGIKTKSSKQQKYMLSVSDGRSMTSPGRMSLSLSTADSTECLPQHLDDELSVVDEADRSSQGSSHQIHMAPMAAVEAVSTERLASRSYYRDWQRLGLGQMAGGRSATLKRMEPFRVSTVNASYTVCRSYPALLPLPCHVGDASAAKVARCHRHGRLPVTTWKHPRTRALLLRGSSFCGKGVRGIIMAHQTTGSSNDSTTVGLEQEKYMSAVVAATPRSVLRKGSPWGASDSSLSIDSLILQAASAHPDMSSATGYPTLTPESGRRGAASHNPFSKAMSTLRMSGGTGPGNKGSLRRGISPGTALRSPSATTLGGAMFSVYKPSVSPRSAAAEADSCSSTAAGVGGSLAADSTDAAAAGGVHTFQKASLYVFGDRSHMKSDAFPKTDFIPVDFAEVKQVKVSFKKLMRACVPSSAAADRDQTFLKAVEGSEWLPQIQRIMQVAGAVVDLVDVQGSSVMLCLEDGWDFTAQVSSVAQLCLDPYYRTLEGFRVLVEKEWLAFGHRFSHRSNLTQPSQASGFAPIFLQFLDVVHQIHSQFPLSFEFNQYFLKLLAYHAVSVRFRTFLLDSELERVETGLMAEEDRQHLLLHSSVSSAASSSHCTAPSATASHPPAAQWFDHNLEEDDDDLPGEPAAARRFSSSLPHSQSVFDYLERHAARTPLLYNFYYVPDPCDQPVLRPHGALSSLRVWSYYCAETLAGGPSYDLEVVALDGRRIEEAEAAEGRPQTSVRRTVTAGYHSRHQLQDSCSYLLEEARRLEAELGQLSQKWHSVWDQLEVPNTDSLARRASPSTQLVRHHGRYVHKRATIKLIMGGKMAISAAAASGGLVAGNGGGPLPPDHPIQPFSAPHRFEKHNYTTPTYCDHCSHVLWGLVKTGMRCADCGYNAHEKCIGSVPKSCNKYKAMLAQSATSGGATVSGGAGYSAGGAAGSAAGDKFDRASVTSGVTSHHGQSASSSQQQQQQRLYDQFSVRTAEHRTLEGYLYKRGVLLKSWKQRWFVLDSIKHELRYYDGMEDQNCKGVIDLAEVISVNPAAPTPGAPKRVDDKAFFELRTVRRAYSFCANDAQAAQEWVEKMQSCLQ